MEAARLPASRVRAALIGALLALAALAWLVVARRMDGMDAGPGTDPGTLGFYTLSWVVMMAAMMFPSIVPMVLAFSSIQTRRRTRGAVKGSISTSLFVAGYLLSWTVFGLAAYAAFTWVRSLSIGALSWSHDGRYLAGGVLVAAAIYQLTPAKDACLRRCRSPLDFVLEHWHDGRLGALRMGAIHGAWCVGCCWMLMAALFALGLMSITWMIVLAAAIAAEKLLPSPPTTNRVIAAALAALGIALISTPSNVPGLVIPNSAQAQRAMQAMHGKQMGAGMHGMKNAPTIRKGRAMPGIHKGARATAGHGPNNGMPRSDTK
jgi:predicted metal-binding membrane protein